MIRMAKSIRHILVNNKCSVILIQNMMYVYSVGFRRIKTPSLEVFHLPSLIIKGANTTNKLIAN